MPFLGYIIPAVYPQAVLTDASGIKEWATYGTEPGVLVGIIVIGCAITVTGVLRYAKWFITWHTEQMTAQRLAHSLERDKLINTLLEHMDED